MAVILVLMIVVAVAALAYTWSTGIFSSLTESVGISIKQTTQALGKKFVLDAATCSGTLIFTIRNTGSVTLNGDLVEAYLDGVNAGASDPGTTIAEGAIQSYTGGSCSSGQTLKVTIENGASNSMVLP